MLRGVERAGPAETARIAVRRPGHVELHTGCASSGQASRHGWRKSSRMRSESPSSGSGCSTAPRASLRRHHAGGSAWRLNPLGAKGAGEGGHRRRWRHSGECGRRRAGAARRRHPRPAAIALRACRPAAWSARRAGRGTDPAWRSTSAPTASSADRGSARTEGVQLGISMLASGPLLDAARAARELEHAVKELGAVGAVAATMSRAPTILVAAPSPRS